ncbi:MAG: hypothetical protein ABIT05_01295 [Chitinophagaceae bacterium]
MGINFDIATIIASAATLILSAFISFLIFRRQKGVEFEYDYRRYILEKRKNIYEKIEELISHFQQFTSERFLGGGAKEVAKVLFEKFDYLEANNVWITFNMQAELWRLRGVITIIIKDDKLPNVEPTQKKIYREQLRQCRVNLINEYFKDITNLNKIDRFKKYKIASYKYSEKFMDEEVRQAHLSHDRYVREG